ncbi:MAG: hypothetical protein QOK23_2903 [Gammaproteobacteria bacterium]|jgi:hypothetical protein|nr:hypothetical protein [Gammaproteobacteria bacterium]MEA3140734.1 hypothetical protein [Gammaproteobacteria bacterium]
MTFKTTGIRSFVGLVWQELSSWGAGVEFSFYDHLQERIDQLEQELMQVKKPPSSAKNDMPSGMIGC